VRDPRRTSRRRTLLRKGRRLGRTSERLAAIVLISIPVAVLCCLILDWPFILAVLFPAPVGGVAVLLSVMGDDARQSARALRRPPCISPQCEDA